MQRGILQVRLIPTPIKLSNSPRLIRSRPVRLRTLPAQLQSLLGANGYLEGCIITMTSGQAKGLSSRIVRYDATTPTNPVLHVLAFKGAAGAIAPQQGDTFLINGRAFSGTGSGFSQASGLLDAKDGSTRPFALLPNPLFYNVKGSPDYDPSPTGKSTIRHRLSAVSQRHSIRRPGRTEYGLRRAPDTSTCSCRGVLSALADCRRTIFAVVPPPRFNQLLERHSQPGFKSIAAGKSHASTDGRHENYGASVSNPDHPQFTGSNPNFDAINGPWTSTTTAMACPTACGSTPAIQCKCGPTASCTNRWVAILCVDLDGRLNVNAAGTTEMLPPSSAFTQSTHLEQFVGATYSGVSASAVLCRIFLELLPELM